MEYKVFTSRDKEFCLNAMTAFVNDRDILVVHTAFFYDEFDETWNAGVSFRR